MYKSYFYINLRKKVILNRMYHVDLQSVVVLVKKGKKSVFFFVPVLLVLKKAVVMKQLFLYFWTHFILGDNNFFAKVTIRCFNFCNINPGT